MTRKISNAKDDLSVTQKMLETLDPSLFKPGEGIGVIVFRMPVSELLTGTEGISTALDNLRGFAEVMDAEFALPPKTTGTITLTDL